jgi:hypothetical protein
LVNTTAIKQYEELKHRGDESDAKHLARAKLQILRCKIFRQALLWCIIGIEPLCTKNVWPFNHHSGESPSCPQNPHG